MEHKNFGLRLLRWCCPVSLYEGIEGDLVERYEQEVREGRVIWAKLRLTWNAIRFIRPGIVGRNKLNVSFMNTQIITNYFKTGWRNIFKHRLYAMINAFGLALGIGFSYLTFLYVDGEMSYDKFHSKADRIYRVVEKRVKLNTEEITHMSSVTAVPLSAGLTELYPEIETAARIGSTSTIVKKGDETFSQVVAFADKQFFEVFDFETIVGSNKIFSNPSDLVLSSKAAHMFFGTDNIIGKPLSVMLSDSLHLFTVTAVVNNHEGESSLGFDVMIPLVNFSYVVGEEVYESLNYGMIETYLMLRNNKSAAFLLEKINNERLKEAKEEDLSTTNLMLLQPLTQLHLDNSVPGGIARLGNPTYVYVLSGIGILILVMACVNFISLTSGHAFSRIKEVGIRKSLGAHRNQIKTQLLTEALIICVAAAGAGIALVYFSVPLFNMLINSTLKFSFSVESSLFLLALIILIVLVAGGIPSRLLVTLQPVQALKSGWISTGRETAKQSLVVVQFTLALVLIIGTFIMNEQMDFIYGKDLGFEKEQLFEVTLNNPASAEQASRVVDLFKSEATSAKRIAVVTAALNDYQEPWTKLAFTQTEGEPIELFYNLVDPDYLQTLRLEMTSGRWFDSQINTSETNQIVVNEALMRYFGWDNFDDRQIPGKNFSETHEIIGVVKDFHFSSLHSRVEPLILAVNLKAIGTGVTGLTTYRWPVMYNDLVIRITPGDVQSAIKEIEATWQAANPDAPFEGHFVDDLLEAQYANEQRWKRIIDYGSGFAYVVSILGLIGLVKLLLQRRVKEIGIRKVLGSGYGHLLTHFSKGFIVVVVVANLVAWPTVWWASRQWLESFSYRVELSPFPFLLGTITVGIGIFMVVSILTWIAAQTRPVEVLKNE